ncbi:GFA family protein, partial [Acinetobacter baumannii]
CGRIRYSVAIDNDDAYLCHCRMCQRATGGVSIAFKGVKIANVAWAREPDRYQSSPIAQRGFCAACGTPLTFEYLEPGETMDLSVGSF